MLRARHALPSFAGHLGEIVDNSVVEVLSLKGRILSFLCVVLAPLLTKPFRVKKGCRTYVRAVVKTQGLDNLQFILNLTEIFI
jgi:hypothetical protein